LTIRLDPHYDFFLPTPFLRPTPGILSTELIFTGLLQRKSIIFSGNRVVVMKSFHASGYLKLPQQSPQGGLPLPWGHRQTTPIIV